MSHPYGEHRDHHVQHRRVHHITDGAMHGGRTIAPHVMRAAKKRAAGGRVDGERDAVAVTGQPARQRLDRPMRAKGGRTKGKGKGTHVNIIMGHPGMGAPAPMAGAPPPGLPPAMPPRPPVPTLQAGAAPGAPMPAGSPIRKEGGRTYARGGAVKSGPAWAGGLKSGTQVQHTNNKLDGHNVGRGPVITRKTGGAIESPGHKRASYKAGNPLEHPVHGHMGPKLAGGSKGGLGRLAKAHRAAAHHG